MGVGLPITETAMSLETILKMMVSYALIYTFAISTIKLSVLCFYLRVFVGDRFRLITKIVTGVVGVYTLANILLLFLICRPFAANYDLSVEGNCGDQPTAFISIGAYNIISDVVILCLPIPMVWRLQAKREMKIGLTIIFLVGLVYVTSRYLLRLYTDIPSSVSGVAVGRIFSLKILNLENITETMVWVDFLSTTEVNLGIFCVSLPMLGPILGRVIKRHGASKLSATPDGNRQFERSSNARSSQRKRAGGDDALFMATIYGDDNANHDASVMAKQAKGEASSQDDGSEVSLNGNSDERGKSIVVKKHWSVSHD